MVLDTSKPLPSLSDIRSFTQSTFHHYSCFWQAEVVEAVLKHDQDALSLLVNATGLETHVGKQDGYGSRPE